MTPEFRFVAKDSVRIGKPCCPKCGGMNMLWRKAGHWYCRRRGCLNTFKTPAKVRPTPTGMPVRASIKRAGPCIYRGLLWANGTQNFSYLN